MIPHSQIIDVKEEFIKIIESNINNTKKLRINYDSIVESTETIESKVL